MASFDVIGIPLRVWDEDDQGDWFAVVLLHPSCSGHQYVDMIIIIIIIKKELI